MEVDGDPVLVDKGLVFVHEDAFSHGEAIETQESACVRAGGSEAARVEGEVITGASGIISHQPSVNPAVATTARQMH